MSRMPIGLAMGIEYGWRVKTSEWSRLKRVLLEHAGDSVAWKNMPLRRGNAMHLKGKSGVYMLCMHPPYYDQWCSDIDKLPLLNVLYVGQSTDLSKRFDNYARIKNVSSHVMENFLHHYNTGARRLIFAYILLGISSLKEVEGSLIRCFGPSVNRRQEGVYAPLPATLKQEVPV